MNQCVPSWDFDENSGMPALDYEVAELTWKNGQVAMHGLGPPRTANKTAVASSPTNWDKPRAGGTLEAIVNQATRLPQPHHKFAAVDRVRDEMVPWFDQRRAMANPAATASVTMTMDALVPCNTSAAAAARRGGDRVPSSAQVLDSGTCVVGCSTRVGSCSGVAVTLDGGGGGIRGPRVEYNSCDTNGSASESATCGGGDSYNVTVDTGDKELGAAGFTSPSMDSPENTSSGKEMTGSIGEDHDSVCYSRRQREKFEENGKKRITGKSSILTKRSRAAAIHNQSERKRRDRINQRMKSLQRLVPNSSKTDKSSMLDEVIEYIKQLQAHVQIMRMNMSPMMLPLAAMQQQQQQFQMSMMAPMGMGMGMGLMDMNAFGRSGSGMVPPASPANAFMPMGPLWDNPGERLPAPASHVMSADPLAAFLAWQSQMMTIDAYSRLAAMYQQFQQPPTSTSKN